MAITRLMAGIVDLGCLNEPRMVWFAAQAAKIIPGNATTRIESQAGWGLITNACVQRQTCVRPSGTRYWQHLGPVVITQTNSSSRSSLGSSSLESFCDSEF